MPDGSNLAGSARKWTRGGLKLLVALLIAVVSLAAMELWFSELGQRGLIRVRPPVAYSLEAQFYQGDHPVFGVLHIPDAEFEHRTSCFHAHYRSNSVGLRDREREPRSNRPRVILLGDSFAEGWGLDSEHRMSDLLERASGVEHLNFAVAHFGPYQALLQYRNLAKDFDHSSVIIALLPENDFVDIDLDLASKMRDYAYTYRPYLLRTPDGYEHFDHRENVLHRLLRRYTWTYGMVQQAAADVRDRLFEEPAAPPAVSRFYEFDEEQFDRLEFILEQLAEEMGGRELVIALLPVRRDFERFFSAGPDLLSRRLEDLDSRPNVRVVNLLPLMAAEDENWKRYFFSCDYHWSAYANWVAARALLDELEGVLYSDPEPLPPADPSWVRD